MNNYEAVFILTPVLSDAQMKEAVEKFKSILVSDGAEIVNEENWGLRKLAYPIDKKSTGFYIFLEFNADPAVIDKLEVNFRRDERDSFSDNQTRQVLVGICGKEKKEQKWREKRSQS